MQCVVTTNEDRSRARSKTGRGCGPSGLNLLLALSLSLLPATSLWGQETSDALPGFEPNGQFLLQLDGVDLPSAQIFLSEREVSFLLLATELEAPLLLSLRHDDVVSVDPRRLEWHVDGSFDLIATAADGHQLERSQSIWAKDMDAYVFEVAGLQARLYDRPPLLGQQARQALMEHDPKLAFGAAKLQLRGGGSNKRSSEVEALASQSGDLKVQVFFNKWCGICEVLMPRVFALEEALGASGTQFEYYGLPKRLMEDPVAEELGIRGVPTAVVYQDGHEIGRLHPLQLQDPAGALADLLGVASP